MKSPKKIAAQITEATKTEFANMLREAAEKEAKEPKIGPKLEELRGKLKKEMSCFTSLGEETFGGVRKQKRISAKTCSEILDIPINELVIYAINEIKNKNERSLVEYHLGTFIFYADE